MIIAKNISKTYTGEPVLKNIDVRVGNDKKIAVVGKNGCGKSTLFKVLLKIEETTEGDVDIQGDVLGYIPQEFDFPDQMVGEYLEKSLENDWETYKIDTLVGQMEFSNYDPYQKINTLSEGQKMKVKLVETMLSDPTILFIDEPTNHLDIEGIMWFERYIQNLQATVVMISHDRSFLNHTVDEVWEIENAGLIQFVGDYDNYKTEKLKLINKWDEEYKRFLRKKDQMEKLLESARKLKGGKQRGRAVKAAKKRIDREVRQSEKEKYVSKKMKEVGFATDIRQSKLMVRFDEVAKSYGDKKVFEEMDFEIRGKEKVWVFGPNGAGKTTLIKMIMGEENVTKGEVKLGDNIKVGYFAQKQTQLDFNKTLLDLFMEETGCAFGQTFGFLKKFLFDGAAIKKQVRHLSPGERARFAFAIFSYKDYDLLILDEPTNHLDIETKEVIEKSLRDFNGTLLLVSHDRYFVERIGMDKVLNLRNGELAKL